jgi:hypothetical protein
MQVSGRVNYFETYSLLSGEEKMRMESAKTCVCGYEMYILVIGKDITGYSAFG